MSILSAKTAAPRWRDLEDARGAALRGLSAVCAQAAENRAEARQSSNSPEEDHLACGATDVLHS